MNCCADFSTKHCAVGCMNDDCILMLSYYRGGLMQVAYYSLGLTKSNV